MLGMEESKIGAHIRRAPTLWLAQDTPVSEEPPIPAPLKNVFQLLRVTSCPAKANAHGHPVRRLSMAFTTLGMVRQVILVLLSLARMPRKG